MENKFENLGLSQNVLKSINKLGFTTPSDIQLKLIPEIIEGYDCLGQAQTGTGKTLAFASAILSKLSKEKNGIKCIILSPTRELALQITKEINMLDIEKKFKTFTVYGGDSITRQIKNLKDTKDIIVGTPGRVKDLINRRKLNLTKIDFFVLDEADEMLNMGFSKDIEEIFRSTSRDKQVLMLSATMSREIKALTSKYMKDNHKHVIIESASKTNDNISQGYYLVNDKQRFDVLLKVLTHKDPNKCIIFTKTRREADHINTMLREAKIESMALHGDISQSIRIKTLDNFKKNNFKYLIATDVAARGIHVNDVDLIINYNLPQDNEGYIHRIGRTGRASNKGEAITLITNKELRILKGIEKHVKSTISELKLPKNEEIKKMKYKKIVDEANQTVNNNEFSEAMEYVRDLNKSDLLNFAAALLKNSVDKEMKYDTKKDLRVEPKVNKNTKDGDTRVFINVGKKDGLKMGSLLDLIKEKTNIRKENFNNIEVLETFSFADVNNKVLEDFMDKFNKVSVRGRKVRIEISNKSK